MSNKKGTTICCYNLVMVLVEECNVAIILFFNLGCCSLIKVSPCTLTYLGLVANFWVWKHMFELSESPLVDEKDWFALTTCKAWRISARTAWLLRFKKLSTVDLEKCSFPSEFSAKDICWGMFFIALACLTVFSV